MSQSPSDANGKASKPPIWARLGAPEQPLPAEELWCRSIFRYAHLSAPVPFAFRRTFHVRLDAQQCTTALAAELAQSRQVGIQMISSFVIINIEYGRCGTYRNPEISSPRSLASPKKQSSLVWPIANHTCRRIKMRGCREHATTVWTMCDVFRMTALAWLHLPCAIRQASVGAPVTTSWLSACILVCSAVSKAARCEHFDYVAGVGTSRLSPPVASACTPVLQLSLYQRWEQFIAKLVHVLCSKWLVLARPRPR